MIAFTKKKIGVQKTLGQILKEKRQEKNIDFEKIEKYTKINKKHLKALENGDYCELPADIYVKNFLKVYSEILELDPENTVSQFLFEREIFQKTKNTKPRIDHLHNNKYNFLNFPRLARKLAIVLIALALLGYLGMGVKKIFTPPLLSIFTPVNNLILEESTVKVSGQTEKEVEININGDKVLSDNKGYFEKDINLQDGLNIIEISVTKKHSKENTVYRKVMVTTKDNQI